MRAGVHLGQPTITTTTTRPLSASKQAHNNAQPQQRGTSGDVGTYMEQAHAAARYQAGEGEGWLACGVSAPNTGPAGGRSSGLGSVPFQRPL